MLSPQSISFLFLRERTNSVSLAASVSSSNSVFPLASFSFRVRVCASTNRSNDAISSLRFEVFSIAGKKAPAFVCFITQPLVADFSDGSQPYLLCLHASQLPKKVRGSNCNKEVSVSLYGVVPKRRLINLGPGKLR